MSTPSPRPPNPDGDPLLDAIRRLEAGVLHEIAELKRDVAEIKGDVAEIKREVTELKREVAEVRRDTAKLREDMARLDGRLMGMDKRLDGVPTLWSLGTTMLMLNSGIVAVAALAVTLFRH